jgi:hypothetical protein
MINWEIKLLEKNGDLTIINKISETNDFNNHLEEFLVDFYENNNAKIADTVYNMFEIYWQDPHNEMNPVTIQYNKDDEDIILPDEHYDMIFEKYYKNKNICSFYKCFSEQKIKCRCTKKYCDNHISSIKKCSSCKNTVCSECLLKPVVLYEFVNNKKAELCKRCNNYYIKLKK